MHLVASSRNGALTARERGILALAGRGLTNQEIGDELQITARTVKCTLHRASSRLGAHNRTQAVILAMARGALHLLDMFSIDEIADLIGSMPPELLAAIDQRLEQRQEPGQLPLFTTDCGNGSEDINRFAGGVECECW
jgi:DNA-binding CsgD family transcriptional regulator